MFDEKSPCLERKIPLLGTIVFSIAFIFIAISASGCTEINDSQTTPYTSTENVSTPQNETVDESLNGTVNGTLNETVEDTIATYMLFNGTIRKGDGYQINNYVIGVVDIFADTETCAFKVYDQGELIHDKILNKSNSYSFDVEEGTIEFTLTSMEEDGLPSANVSITITENDSVYLKQMVHTGTAIRKPDLSNVRYYPFVEVNTDEENDLLSNSLLFEGIIEEGDGYQINDAVIDVVEVDVESESCRLEFYDRYYLASSTLLNTNSSFPFSVDEEVIEITLNSVSSGLVPQANVSITITNNDTVYLNQLVDGGHYKVKY